MGRVTVKNTARLFTPGRFGAQAQVVDLSVANGVGEDSPSTNPSELGDGLVLDDGIAQRLFQFQRTGAGSSITPTTQLL